jgi:hypothetical protein
MPWVGEEHYAFILPNVWFDLPITDGLGYIPIDIGLGKFMPTFSADELWRLTYY